MLRCPCYFCAALLGYIVQPVAGDGTSKQWIVVNGKVNQCLSDSILPELA